MKRNRIITTLLVACTSLLLAFGLTACEKKCEHTYDNACDAICNICSETREVDAHIPETDDGDCTTEIVCSVCGTVTTEAKEAHTPNADDGNCTTAITCSDCGTVTTEAQQAHTPNADDGNCLTAITCSDCGTETTEAKEAHTPNADDEDCTTSITCEYCDHIFVEAKSHNFATGEAWNSTHTEHWYICLNEGCEAKNDYGEHVPEEDDGDCTTHLLCDVCGWVVVKGNDSHTPNADDGNCLTAITCSVCGTVTTEAKEAHTLTVYITNSDGTHTPACEYCHHMEPVKEPHTDEDDGDCTTFVVCSKCGLITKAAKEAHTPNADDGSCLTAITCSDCGTVTTEAKENHTTTRFVDNKDDTHNLLCQYCDYVEVENERHTFDSTTGECVCGLARIYIADYSVTGDFPSGWNNETNLNGTTGTIGTLDTGKTAWEDGDLIVIDFTSSNGVKEMQGLKYYGNVWTVTSNRSLYYLSNETPTIRAIYSPYYKIDGFGFVLVGSLDGSDSLTKGECEYIEIDCELSDSETVKVDFSTATRNYSRLRIVAIAGQELTVTTTGFTPAGASAEATRAYTITADSKGNAYLYGTFAEGTTVTVKDNTNEILAEYTFTEKTEVGTSYVLKAVPPIEITFTETAFKQGSYTSEALSAPTTASLEFQCLNSEQDIGGGAFPASHDYQIKVTAMYVSSSGEEEVLATTDWVDENNPDYTKVGSDEEATSLAVTQEMLTQAGAQSYWFVFEYFTQYDASYTQVVHVNGSISN